MHRLRLIFLLAAASWTALSCAQELIAAADVPDRVLTRNQARLYFTQRMNLWSDGTPVEVFVLPDDHPLHQSFCKHVLGLYPYQLRRVWDRMIFSGTGQAPRSVATEEQMIKGVASTPGAIGYATKGVRPPNTRSLEVR